MNEVTLVNPKAKQESRPLMVEPPTQGNRLLKFLELGVYIYKLRVMTSTYQDNQEK